VVSPLLYLSVSFPSALHQADEVIGVTGADLLLRECSELASRKSAVLGDDLDKVLEMEKKHMSIYLGGQKPI
jgi:hypothetical protein